MHRQARGSLIREALVKPWRARNAACLSLTSPRCRHHEEPRTWVASCNGVALAEGHAHATRPVRGGPLDVRLRIRRTSWILVRRHLDVPAGRTAAGWPAPHPGLHRGAKDPYLFAIDSDEPETTVDPEVIGDHVEFRTHLGARRLDEKRHVSSDVLHAAHARQGRRFDRSACSASPRALSARVRHRRPPDSTACSAATSSPTRSCSASIATRASPGYRPRRPSRRRRTRRCSSTRKVWAQPIGDPRKLLTTNIDGHDFDLHIDLGEAVSQLWAAPLARRGAPAARVAPRADRRDRHAPRHRSPRDREAGATARLTRDNIAFARYDDRRYYYNLFDGTLGLDFFRPSTSP